MKVCNKIREMRLRWFRLMVSEEDGGSSHNDRKATRGGKTKRKTPYDGH